MSQVGELSREVGGRLRPVAIASGSPLRGRPLASAGRLRDFERAWAAAFDELCKAEGIVKTFRLTQGCVIEKVDGSVFQLRNFDKGQPWMKGGAFKGIRRVYGTPFVAMRNMRSG